MRGLIFGFVAEYKLRSLWLSRPGISNLFRPRSHDRKKKGDFQFSYGGRSVVLEVKCLDTPRIRYRDGVYEGTFQCNASDTTRVALPDATSVVTNCLAVGGFDVLAVCLHGFGGSWRFGFARNETCPEPPGPSTPPRSGYNSSRAPCG